MPREDDKMQKIWLHYWVCPKGVKRDFFFLEIMKIFYYIQMTPYSENQKNYFYTIVVPARVRALSLVLVAMFGIIFKSLNLEWHCSVFYPYTQWGTQKSQRQVWVWGSNVAENKLILLWERGQLLKATLNSNPHVLWLVNWKWLEAKHSMLSHYPAVSLINNFCVWAACKSDKTPTKPKFAYDLILHLLMISM